MPKPIYMDYNATTPVDRRVVDRMLPFFTEEYGNPSNTSHAFGWAADEAANIAREELGALIHATPEEIFFTGGATEAINTAIKGVAKSYLSRGRHIITCDTEHSAVLETCRNLAHEGFEITYLPVDRNGLLSPDSVRGALREDTILVAAMWANNETGVIHPIAELAKVVSSHRAFFLTDATQAVGKVPVDVEGIDFLACSAHKLYGPKGVGALFVRSTRPPIRLAPLVHGGSQEKGRRAGTLNVPGIVGLGAAAKVADELLAKDYERMSSLRDRFEEKLIREIDGVTVNGAGAPRLPQTSNVTFAGINAGEMIADIGRLAVSMGSACGTGQGKPSHVLSAYGLDKAAANGTIRFSLGRSTTMDEIDEAVALLAGYIRASAR